VKSNPREAEEKSQLLTQALRALLKLVGATRAELCLVEG
jgi:hypothetical protein